jgi:hypothetical protein
MPHLPASSSSCRDSSRSSSRLLRLHRHLQHRSQLFRRVHPAQKSLLRTKSLLYRRHQSLLERSANMSCRGYREMWRSNSSYCATHVLILSYKKKKKNRRGPGNRESKETEKEWGWVSTNRELPGRARRKREKRQEKIGQRLCTIT